MNNSGKNNYDKLPSTKTENDFPISLFSGLKGHFIVVRKFLEGKEVINIFGSIESVTGFRADDILSKAGDIFTLIDDYYKESVRKSVLIFYSDVNLFETELIYPIKNFQGQRKWLKETLKVQRDEKGKPENIISFFSDITALKEAEDKLAARVKDLEDLNSSKDGFISILSHDLRAPFTSILGFSEILMNEAGISEKDRQEYLQYIYGSSKHLLQLINNLLDWSRIQTNRIKFDVVRLQAQNTIYQCISSLTQEIVNKRLNIRVDLQDNIFIEADEKYFSLAIMNLLSNAVKYSHEGGNILVRAFRYNDRLIEFVVKDEGVGINETNRSKIFKIDRVFSTQGTKGEKGTGLGLTLAKEIINKLKGEIWFYSEPGDGSEFHFTIPSSPSILLLVQNDQTERDDNLAFIKREFPNLNIINTDNGYKAIELALTKLPGVIASDHDLPLMTGLQIFQMVRKNDKHGKVKFILLCPPLNKQTRKLYLDAGVEDFIEKPIDQNIFYKILGKYF
ncbi:MAG: response regulator [Ignavibacteriaceae bacterium]|nr:response regulator [Ignavibacteriaceae bacterium]